MWYAYSGSLNAFFGRNCYFMDRKFFSCWCCPYCRAIKRQGRTRPKDGQIMRHLRCAHDRWWRNSGRCRVHIYIFLWHSSKQQRQRSICERMGTGRKCRTAANTGKGLGPHEAIYFSFFNWLFLWKKMQGFDASSLASSSRESETLYVLSPTECVNFRQRFFRHLSIDVPSECYSIRGEEHWQMSIGN